MAMLQPAIRSMKIRSILAERLTRLPSALLIVDLHHRETTSISTWTLTTMMLTHVQNMTMILGANTRMVTGV